MFEGLTELFFIILGGGMLLIGVISLGYGMYGMSVKGFDKSVQNTSIGIGIILIIIVTVIWFFSPFENNEDPLKFVGNYQTSDDRKLKIELKQDGSIIADSSLFTKTKGNWELIDFDEFYKIDLTISDGETISFNIIEEEFIKLKTDENITQIEDRLELIKID